MKLYSWNVNGIRSVVNKGAFQQFIKDHDPDILCLQETKAMQGQAQIDLPQYTEYWNSADKKGYSGTAIFTKYKPLNVVYDLPLDCLEGIKLDDRYGNTNREGRVTTAEFEKFFVVTVYTPNSKGDLTRLSLRHTGWDVAFLRHVKKLEKTKPVLFCGDLNVAHTELDLARPKENIGEHGFTHEERAGFDNILKAGFVDTFRIFTEGNGHYSWWTNWGGARARNVGWRIDYWIASAALVPHIQKAEIHADVMGSDHCPVSVNIHL